MPPRKKWKRPFSKSSDSVREPENPPSSVGQALYVFALRTLARRSYATAELKKRLLERSQDEALVSSVLRRLTSDRYLDDRLFVEGFIQSRREHKHQGRLRIESELRSKGLDLWLIHEVMNRIYPQADDAPQIALALDKKLRSLPPPIDAKKAARLYNYLLRRGFPAEAIYREIHRRLKDIDLAD